MIGVRKLLYYRMAIKSLLCKLYVYFKAIFIWNISIGKNCTFNGNTIFFKMKNSDIIIGNKCRFVSDTRFNLIGINRKCIVSTHTQGAKIVIGENSGFSGTSIGASLSIRIGNYVKCGANTLITDFDWHLEDPRSGSPKEVIIEDNVWLGVNSTVLKGVTIGKNSLIGANSVVTKDIPPNVVAAGNPCKVIKNISQNIISLM